jgi:hypothetical protein
MRLWFTSQHHASSNGHSHQLFADAFDDEPERPKSDMLTMNDMHFTISTPPDPTPIVLQTIVNAIMLLHDLHSLDETLTIL